MRIGCGNLVLIPVALHYGKDMPLGSPEPEQSPAWEVPAGPVPQEASSLGRGALEACCIPGAGRLEADPGKRRIFGQ